ncbi:MAG: hypothetical protein R3A12_03810 [Ignavibacteria bacterium]
MGLSINLSELKKSLKKSKYIDLVNPRLDYPKSKFLIYTRGRTGSTVLTDLLNCHPDVFCDVEIFNFLYSGSKIKFPEMYIKSCSKRAAKHGKSVYGFKVKIAQLRYEHEYDNYEEILRKLFNDGYKFIYLKRDNYFRHKLSNIISAQTRIFHLKNGDENSPVKVKVDCDQLMEGIQYSEVVNKTESENLKDIDHITITYEDDLIENSKHQETADKIFGYLGLEPVKVRTDLKRIVPEDLEK